MPDRYWVGGAGTWNTTNTANWSATSGGAGGASVPTTADDVFFNASSGTGTITVGSSVVAGALNFTGFTATFSAGTNQITCTGSVTFVSTGSITLSSSTIVMTPATGITATLNSGGRTLSTVLLNGQGTVSVQSNLNCLQNFTVDRGTFNLNSFSLQTGSTGSFISNTTNTRTINLGSGTLVCQGNNPISIVTTGLTFNAGTSSVVLSGSAPTFTGMGLTWHNVQFSQSGNPTITGANTFNNLRFWANSNTSFLRTITISDNQVVNGTFIMDNTSGLTGRARYRIESGITGIAVTIRAAAVSGLVDIDFRQIYFTGAAAPVSGTRLGNCGNNRGITFDAPKTVYWVASSAGDWNSNSWSNVSGGLANSIYYPLPQDIAVITNAAPTSGTITYTISGPRYLGTVDCSARTSALTLSMSAATTFFGSYLLGSGVTPAGAFAFTFSGDGVMTLRSAGKTLPGGVTVDSYGGTVQLADALNIGSNTLTITNGTFSTQNYNVTTARVLSSNSNVRTINFGSSTLTITQGIPIDFATSTNLTFNAGTSQITCSAAGLTFNGGDQTFNNVAFSVAGSNVVTGANTFNNLTVTAPSSAGLIDCSFNANQTITGTLTCAGATAVRRIFLRSNTLGTTRTLTVNSLSAQDCDFRDITIMGAAAGSSPVRAGDCGGNTGITFPAPKTVYWVQGGTVNWLTTNGWSNSSGGTPDVNQFPLAQDTVIIDNNSGGAGTTLLISGTVNIGTLSTANRTVGSFQINTSISPPNFYGSVDYSGSITTPSSSATGFTFAGRGTQTITSAGKTFNIPITINSFSGTVQLADSLTIASNRALTVNSGTFDAVTYNVTTGSFVATTGTLRMGSGTWTLSGTGTVWSTPGDLVFFKGTSNIVLSNTSTAQRDFLGGGLSYNKLTIGGATGTSTTTINSNNYFTELASTKTVAHTISFGSTTQTFGSWTVTGTVNNVVTLAGSSTSHILAGACTRDIDYLAMTTVGFASTSPGEFYAGANSTATSPVAPVYLTAKPADSTRFWVGGTGNWSDTARWSTSSGGAGGASVPRSHDDVVFDSASNATAYTATVNAVTGGIRCKALTITGPASGNLTLAGSVAINGIHGNVTLPATGLTRTYTGAITLSGSATGRTITTNGVVLGSTININGFGCEWGLGSAINSNQFSIINGSFITNNYNLNTQFLDSAYTTPRNISLGSSTVSISGFNQPVNLGTTNAQRNQLTFNAGTSQISIGVTSLTFSGNNQTFHNVSFTSTLISDGTINGVNTFNNLSFTGRTSAGIANLSFSANQTINGTLTLSAGTNATMRTFLRSDTIGTPRTLTCAAVSATDVDFRDIIIAGAAAPVSGTRLGDCKGNSGITFDAPKTVWWSAANANWGSQSWAFTPEGAKDFAAFPLAQDTAVFTATSPGTGSPVTINAAYNIGTIDMSARTSNTMTLATSTNAPTIYGNWINGTATTLTGTGTLTFAGRGSQTITSAGKTFTQPFGVDTPDGSVTLQDALSNSFASNTAIQVFRGSFNANNYNVTLSAGGLFSSNTNTRTIAIGSGLWTIGGGGTNIWGNAISTGLTITGTGTLSFTSASAKSFGGGSISYSGITINQAGAGALTITGNNTFANISNTFKSTGATSIILGATTQRVANFTASGEAGRVLTISGTSASSPATLILTSGTVTTPDYLAITGVRAYSLFDTWYAGNNSTNNGSLGWYFISAPLTSSIYYGAVNITSIYYGSTPVTAIYYGSARVF